jgi:hypothetical protein
MSSPCTTTCNTSSVRSHARAVITLIALLPLSLVANTTALEPLKSEQDLIGVWEAIVQDSSMASGLYRMEFRKDRSAYLVEVFGTDNGGNEKFLGKLTAIEAKNGKIKARFNLVSGHMNYYDWIEVQGSAVAEGDAGAIDGKIHIHRTGSVMDDWTEPVVFKKGPWLTSLMNASKKAGDIIAHSTSDRP